MTERREEQVISNEGVESSRSNADSIEKLKLVFDYTKFHIGLYTGAATALIALATFGSAFPVPRSS